MIRSILFKGSLRGNGVVNFDSPDQRFVLRKRFPEERKYFDYKNVKIAKHVFYEEKNAQGEIVWRRKLCISADCLRQAIFGEDFPFQNTTVMQHPDLLLGVLASVPALLRGYMFAEEGRTALKRKSPVMVSSAEQTSSGVTSFEIGTMSGKRETKESEDGPSGTGMHYEEKIGAVEYAFEGAIDLKELQFISLSELYDRMAIPPDCEVKFREALGRQLGSEIPAKQWHVMKGAVIRTPEEGILLTQEQTARMCTEFFKRLLRARIQRAKGFAQVAKVQVKFVSDTLADTFDEEAGWRTLKTEKEMGLKPAEVATFFEVVSPADAEALNKSFAAAKADNAQKRKTNNEAKKKASDAKKSSSRKVS